MALKLAQRAAQLQTTLIRQVFDAAAPGAINLGLGQPALPPPSTVMEALERAAQAGKAAYTPNAGDPDLRRRVADELYDGAPLESVLITIGSEEAMYCALTALCDPGDEVLIPEPGYPAYRVIPSLIGVNAKAYCLVPEQGFAIDVDALLNAVTPKTRAVIITSPSNPLGRFAGSTATLARLVAELESRGIWVIDDCLYRDIAFVEHHAPLFRLGQNVVTIDAISKSYACTGLRVGWLHAPQAIVPQLIAVHQAIATAAPTPCQEAAKACLDLRKTDYKARISQLYRERAHAAVTALRSEPKIRFAEPEGAFYLFADLRAFGVDTVQMAFSLARTGQVIVVPGEAFGASAAGFMRITFAPEPKLVTEGVERLLRFLKAA